MVGAYLAFLLGCQFSFGHSGFGQTTCVAPPTTLGETTCSALPMSSPCSTYCPWSSTWTTGLEGFGGPSFLESGRANGAVIAPDSRINTVTNTATSPTAVEPAKLGEDGVALPPEPRPSFVQLSEVHLLFDHLSW